MAQIARILPRGVVRGWRITFHTRAHASEEEQGKEQAADQPFLGQDLQKDVVREVPIVLLIPDHAPSARPNTKERVVLEGRPRRAPVLQPIRPGRIGGEGR